MTYYEGEILSGREISPGIEHTIQDELVAIFKMLMEAKGMYQNMRVPEAVFDPFVCEDHSSASLIREFRRRPVYPLPSRDYDPTGNTGGHAAPTGNLNTPQDQRPLGFYLPPLNLECAICKHNSTFISLQSSGQPHASPYPLLGDDTEQVFPIYYRCATCRGHLITFLILRVGLRCQLVGRSTPFRPHLASEWPASIKNVIEDALAAVAENDVSAGYYHLRTAIEFYMKEAVQLPIATKIDGTDLCERYNKTLDGRQGDFPSLAPIHATLSEGVHTRRVDVVQFEKLIELILDHLSAKAMFMKYSKK